MSKELAVQSNRSAEVAKFDANNNPFLAAGQGSGDYFGKRLSLNGNTGKIHIGPKDDDEFLDEGTELVMDLFTAEMGHVCWVDEEMVEEAMFAIVSGKKLPDIKELTYHGPYEKHDDGTEDGWQVQYRFKCYDEKTGEAYTYATTSKSGVRGSKKLIKTYGQKFALKVGADGLYQYPIVIFDIAGFKIKDKPKLGTKYAPDFDLVDWVDASEVAHYFAEADNPADYDPDEDDDAAEEVVEKKTTRAAKEDDKPARGGRGSTKAKDEEEDKPARGGRSSRAAKDEDDEPAARTSRSSRAAKEDDEPAEETRSSRSSRAAKDEDDEPAAGRRTSVRHAAPQDKDEDVDAGVEGRRSSARGRRGRG